MVKILIRKVDRMTALLLRLFVKDHENTDDPRTRAACGKMAGIVGIVCNVLLSAAKLIIGSLAGAVSITADAVNNLSDAASSLVTMVGFRLAERPADKEHPYGHARIEYLAGMIVAMLILLVGYELAKSSITKIISPEPTIFSPVTILVLAISILVKLWMCLFNRKLGKKINSTTLLATAADSRNDAIATGAVLVSCVVSMLFHVELDAYMGLAVALFILYSGIGVLRDTANPLLGSAPEAEEFHRVAERICAHDHVLGIHDLMIHDYGPGRRFASVHVEMDRNLDVMIGHDIIDDIEREFAVDGLQLVIHYDPVVTDDAVTNAAKAQITAIITGIDERLALHDFRMVEGPGHTNVIFDLVVPFELAKQAKSLKTQIAAAVRQKHPDYYTVISIDSDAFN